MTLTGKPAAEVAAERKAALEQHAQILAALAEFGLSAYIDDPVVAIRLLVTQRDEARDNEANTLAEAQQFADERNEARRERDAYKASADKAALRCDKALRAELARTLDAETTGNCEREREAAGCNPADPLPAGEDTRRQTWESFRESGMLWMANRVLHVFGWAIVVEIDDATETIIGAHPRRCTWRGFSPESEARGFRSVSRFLRAAGATLADEADS